MKKTITNLLLIFFGFACFLVLFFLVDKVFGHFLGNQEPQEFALFVEAPEPPFGYAPDPDSSIHHVRKNSDGSVIFDVNYTFDEYARRVSVQPEGEKTKMALFFGGSYTFGEGLNDSETIASNFARINSKFTVHNYAYRGYGPQQMLIKLRNGFEEGEISSFSGFAFYYFLNVHINRVKGTSSVLSWSEGKHPLFELEGGQLVNRGYHSTASPVFTFFAWHLGKTNIFRHFEVDYPALNKKDVLTTCSIFNESKRILEFRGIQLILYTPLHGKLNSEIMKCLSKPLVLHTLAEPLKNPEQYLIPGDGHINQIGTRKIAEWISKLVK